MRQRDSSSHLENKLSSFLEFFSPPIMHQDMKQHVHKGNKDTFERVCALIMIGDLQMTVYGENVEKIESKHADIQFLTWVEH